MQEVLRAKKPPPLWGAAVWERRGLRFRFSSFKVYQSIWARAVKPLIVPPSKPAIVVGPWTASGMSSP